MKIYHTLITWLMLALAAMAVASCSDDDDEAAMRYPAPTITEFSPNEAFPTGIVTIKGTNFGSERTERVGRVYFGGVEATEYVSWSDTEIQVRVPENGQTGNLTLWVWKNHTETVDEFTCLPSAEFTDITPNPAYPGGEIELIGKNFQNFIDRGVTAQDVTVEFPTEANEEGMITVTANALTATSVKVTIPEDAKGGKVYVQFGDYQRKEGPELNIIGDIPDYAFPLGEYAKANGEFIVDEDGVIGSTKRGAYFVYEFTVPVDGFYNVLGMCTTNQTYPCYVNIDMGTNLDELANRAPNNDLYQTIECLGWSNMKQYTWGEFRLRAGQTYYMRIYLWAEDTSWVVNMQDVILKYVKNPTTPGINVDGGLAYNIYQNDFNNGDSMLPFSPQWAWDPCYIKVVDQCAEFYYNHAALEADDRRERKGCELICDFKTNTEGWYGFKIFLPEGKFPMDEDGILIAQIFNQGCCNSWAGHLGIYKGVLKLSHRNALIDPVVGTVGSLETDKWYSVVLHFKVGKNNKGRLQAWLGDDMTENSPAYDSGSCDFGFGHWIDDETLDDTGSNPDCSGYNGTYDALGCKFGLYVQNKKDITIRFDDLKALEGNPDGAFDIVKPSI